MLLGRTAASCLLNRHSFVLWLKTLFEFVAFKKLWPTNDQVLVLACQIEDALPVSPTLLLHHQSVGWRSGERGCLYCSLNKAAPTHLMTYKGREALGPCSISACPALQNARRLLDQSNAINFVTLSFKAPSVISDHKWQWNIAKISLLIKSDSAVAP